MNFYTVMRWVMEANEEELLALQELLAFIKARPKLWGEMLKATANITPTSIHTSERVLDKDGNPMSDKLKKSIISASTRDTYKPASHFAMKWWKRLQATATPLSAKTLAHLVGNSKRAKEVSNTLGTLHRRGLVVRTWAKNEYLYTIK